MRELAAIVIPYFGADRHAMEHALIRRAWRELQEFSFVFVSADDVDDRPIQAGFPGCTVYRFDASFFENRKGYTSLTLKEDFYDLFGWSEFILLFEPDSFIVKNQLHYWCKQGHDYIAGDDGRLSLRNVDRFLSYTKKNRREIHGFLSGNGNAANDHAFWERKSKGIWPALRSPTPIVSAYFSRPVAQHLANPGHQELPFALTGFDIHSEAHSQWLEAQE